MIAAPIKAVHGAVPLTQSDGDLAAHIRMGDAMLAARALPAHSVASYTARDDPLVLHGWLSEVWFSVLYRSGGLPLLAAFTGIVIGATHGLVAVFLRRRGVDPRWTLVAALMSLALAIGHWLTRPHMFSIAGALLTLFLLVPAASATSDTPRKRSVWRAPVLTFALFAVWANLHGGWLYGLLMIATYATGEVAEWVVTREASWLRGARTRAVQLAAGTMGTLINPYGMGLHREVVGAVTSSSLAANISEYLPPNFQELVSLPFLLALLVALGLLALSRERMPLPWLAVVLVSSLFALRSFRNIALFGVTAWPLIALHAARSWAGLGVRFRYFNDFARLDRTARTGVWSIPVLVGLLLLGTERGRIGDLQIIEAGFDTRKFPVAAVDSARRANLQGRIFHPWVWGGYLMHSWRDRPIHVDPLKFNEATVRSFTRIETLRPGWHDELMRWNVGIVMLRPTDALATELATRPEWRTWYRDSAAVVYVPSSQ